MKNMTKFLALTCAVVLAAYGTVSVAEDKIPNQKITITNTTSEVIMLSDFEATYGHFYDPDKLAPNDSIDIKPNESIKLRLTHTSGKGEGQFDAAVAGCYITFFAKYTPGVYGLQSVIPDDGSCGSFKVSGTSSEIGLHSSVYHVTFSNK